MKTVKAIHFCLYFKTKFSEWKYTESDEWSVLFRQYDFDCTNTTYIIVITSSPHVLVS